MKFVVLFSFFCALVGAIQYGTPGATYEAKHYTKWTDMEGGSRRAEISYDFTGPDGSSDFVRFWRLDLVGTPYERGYAHGRLMAHEIVEFSGPKLNEYFREMVMSLDLSNFPEPIQSVLKVMQLKGAAGAPELFHTAMAYVWDAEKKYVPSHFFEEIDGMSKGICAGLKQPSCNATEWNNKISSFNMLPELIRMACTAYGAWGKATPHGGLIQLRSLDFGIGPWSNYTVLAVHRGDPDNANPYVSVSLPGFVGAITGVSQNGVGISQKVHMVYDTKTGLLPGEYDGEPDVFVLRDILAYKKTRQEAEAYVQSISRTFAIWIGVGDYASQKLDLMDYKRDSVTIYTPETIGSATGQPYIEDVCYVDQHPQPSGEGPTGTLPTALQDFYGNITSESSKYIMQYHKSGDMHLATYDYVNKHIYVAVGRINAKGQYGPTGGDEWKAFNRPYNKFYLEDLWAGL